MSQAQYRDWLASNQAYLLAELDRLRRFLLEQSKEPGAPPVYDAQKHAEQLTRLAAQMPWPPALLDLQAMYSLSPFELDLLLLCAGCELSTEFQSACAKAGGGSSQPTLALALLALSGGYLSALSPEGALRRGRLLRMTPSQPLISSPLRIEEPVLQFLLGLPSIDERLRVLLREVEPGSELLPSQRAVAQQASRLLLVERAQPGETAAVWLCGPDAAARRMVAAQVASEFGLLPYVLRSTDVPQAAGEREELLALWERDQRLSQLALILSYHDSDPPETLQAAGAWLERAAGLCLCTARELLRAGERPSLRLEVPRPDRQEQVELWRSALAVDAAPDSNLPDSLPSSLPDSLNDTIEQLASHFRLSHADLLAASAHARGRTPQTPATVTDPADAKELEAALWEACRNKTRPRLDELAQRIECRANWDDLVLPEAQTKSLREIAAHKRHQTTVYHRWGFGRASARGLGVTSLFVGPSGTGKTLAAEVVARALELDLYRVDLSQVISKYIGETEKNLRRVFDAADEGGAVLLFDEADALFGKRTEIKDSHDRYANVEVSYLLQRMESYQGISILTSNMRSALDTAFLRRIRFIIQFPFPDKEQRAELWRRALPSGAPRGELNLDKLARLNVAGGYIRNIALGAAFLAADENQPLAMRHMLQAARSEYAKLERPITDAEIGGWV